MKIFWPAPLAILISIMLVGGLVYFDVNGTRERGSEGSSDPIGFFPLDWDGDGIPDRIDLFHIDRDNDGIPDSQDFFPDYDGALLITVWDIVLVQDFHSYSTFLAQIMIIVNGEAYPLPVGNVTLDLGQTVILESSILVDVPDDIEEGSLTLSVWALHPSNTSLDGTLALDPEGGDDDISYFYSSTPTLNESRSTASSEELASVQAVLNFTVQAAPMEEVTSFSWQFKGQSYSLDLSIQNHLYYHYYAHNIPRHYTNAQAAAAFVTPQDMVLVSLAENLSALFDPGWTIAEQAGMVMAMVQSMTYALDNESSGTLEYWSFPVETLFKGMGDCEDTTLLLASLYRYFGYECAILLFFPTNPNIAGHAAVALALDDWDGFYYIHGGKRYYYVETTSTGWAIGEIPSDYEDVEAIFIPV